MTPDEREGFLGALKMRLDATNPDLNRPLWRFVTKHVSATIRGVEDGSLSEDDLIEAYEACIDYEILRGKPSP